MTSDELLQQLSLKSLGELRQIENRDLGEMLYHWSTAKEQILATVQANFPGESWSLVEMQTGPGARMLTQINEQIQQLMTQLSNTTLNAAINQYSGSQLHSAYLLDQMTPNGVEASLDVLPKFAIQQLVSAPFEGATFSQRYGAISDAMASDIRDQLVQSMIQGESMSQAAERLDDVMGKAGSGYTDRTLTIARDQIIRAQAEGARELFAQNSDILEDEPTWQATPDDRLCPWCLGRDGKTPSQIKKLHLSARGRSDPHQGKNTIPLHPRCRCAWLPKIKSWKDLGLEGIDEADEDARTIRTADGKTEQVPVETFKQWEKRRAQQFSLHGQ